MKNSNDNTPTPESKVNLEENTSLWDKIVNFFTPEDNSKKKETPNIQGNIVKCNCKRTHSKYYCDSIYEILDMIKDNKTNLDSDNSIRLYHNLLGVCEKELDINGDNIKQIKKDLPRTYPSSIIFKNHIVQTKLKNVLRAFSNYEPTIKYFQGMNFIVGFFLYHCDEHVAFWLFVAIMEEYDLRSLFMKDFPGLKVHVEKVENILKTKYSQLYNNLQKINVRFEIFMMEWLYSMFSSLIPLELQIDFYKGFFSQGWNFFYKMCISAITNLSGTFSSAEEIYIYLKCGSIDDSNVTEEQTKKYWKKIISRAYNLNDDNVVG